MGACWGTGERAGAQGWNAPSPPPWCASQVRATARPSAGNSCLVEPKVTCRRRVEPTTLPAAVHLSARRRQRSRRPRCAATVQLLHLAKRRLPTRVAHELDGSVRGAWWPVLRLAHACRPVCQRPTACALERSAPAAMQVGASTFMTIQALTHDRSAAHTPTAQWQLRSQQQT